MVPGVIRRGHGNKMSVEQQGHGRSENAQTCCGPEYSRGAEALGRAGLQSAPCQHNSQRVPRTALRTQLLL